jgi:response regulator RpfG family c-di-GMP phosphodiesterase
VDEALIGGQKRLDVNKNKRLDSQDFKLLRAKKKKPMQEQEQKKPWWMTSTAAELAAAAQSASDARRGEEAEKRKRHAQQNRRMKWTLADKAQGKKTVKEAAMGKPKKMKMLRKIKDGKVVSQRVIRVPDPTPKKS